MSPTPSHPQLRADLRWIGVGDDATTLQVLDAATARRLALGPGQAEVLRACDGRRTVAAIADSTGYDGSDVEALLAHAAALDLLADPDDEAARVAARHAVRRASLDGERDAALARVLDHAAAISVYRDHAPPTAGDPLARLAVWPVLDRSTMRAAFPDRLLPLGRGAAELYVRRSSGTASDGVQSFREAAEDEAQQQRLWTLGAFGGGAVGCRFTTRQCQGGGCALDPTALGPRHVVQDGVLWLDLRDDAWSLDDRALDGIDDAIRTSGTTHFGADAAYLARWIHYMRERGRPVPRVHHVQTGFADTAMIHRALVDRTFDCPIVDLYSSSELGAVAVECSAGVHHLLEPLFHGEVLGLDDDRLVEPGALGELVVTTLARTIAPLVRYRTGDLVRAVTAPCRCGAAEQAFVLEGRRRDAIVRDGRLVPSHAIDRAIGDDAEIQQYQLDERAPGSYELRVLGRGEAAAARVSALLGAPVRARTVARITAAPSGKYALVRPWSSGAIG